MGSEVSSIHPLKDARDLQFIVGIDQSLYRLRPITRNYTYTKLMDVVTGNGSRLIKGKTDNKERLWYSKYRKLRHYLQNYPNTVTC